MARASIRKALIISLVVLSITPILLLGGILTWQSFRVQQIQVTDVQQKQSMLAAEQVSSYILEQESILKSIAINFDLINMDHEKRYILLSKILSSATDKYHRDIFTDIRLLDSEGMEVARVSRTLYLTDADLEDRSRTDEFLIPAENGDVYYSPVYVNEQTGEPLLKISIPRTDLQTLRLEGVLVAGVRMNYIWDIIANIRVGESGIVYMLDKDGRIIAHPNPSVVLRGTYFKLPEQPGITDGLDGSRVVLASEKIQFGEQLFYVVTELPAAEAMKYPYRTLLTAAVFLVLTLLCAVALGVVLVRRIVRPIESLAGTAHAISAGDLSVSAEAKSPDEIGALAGAFNNMSLQLITKIDDLNKEIEVRTRAEEQIKTSLDEKELLLREIHHRVKNNMQIISSILHLQSGYTKDEQSLATLRESKNRVDVMATIHEKLYQSKSLAKINFQEYIKELLTSLLTSYGVNTRSIRSEVHAEGIYFDINTAIPCGLILNELISNCLKHAFPEGKSGHVKITLHPDGEGVFTLQVSDDGIGFPENIDFRNTDSLGLQLVNALTGQLSGTIEIERNRGTAFKITFNEMKSRKKS